MLLFESQSCSKSFCLVRAVTCPSFVCILAPVCVCFQPLCPVGGPANTHTHIRTSCTQTRSALDPRRSSVIWQPHIFSRFLVHFQAPASFFSVRHSLGHFFLSSLLLRFLSSPIQVNHPIVYLMKGTAFFFLSLSFTYSRLTVLLQRRSFAPNKEIIQRVQGTAFRERCLAGDLL